MARQSPPPAEPLLPPPDIKRWSPARKAAVIIAIGTGQISRDEARLRYLISAEELTGWEKAFDQDGVPGLRATRQQSYRAVERYRPVPARRDRRPPPSVLTVG
ncbi:MAG TPA: DUF1153 domain-containing protein [Stellaceae bacterium]|nr:DUF1153 domain-containing protein [Stellaceae bacterium]